MKEEITIKTIEKLANLSQINLSDIEKDNLVKEVVSIMDMLNGCDLVDTSDDDFVPQSLSFDDLREDLDENYVDKHSLFDGRKNLKDGFVTSPKVVD